MDYKQKSWMQPPARIAPDKITESFEADVVVLGAGHVGTAAAKAAVETGASVVVVEQQMERSFRVFGAQFGVINSKFGKQHGIDEYDPVDLMLPIKRLTAPIGELPNQIGVCPVKASYLPVH